jgi:hypothetical protein
MNDLKNRLYVLLGTLLVGGSISACGDDSTVDSKNDAIGIEARRATDAAKRALGNLTRVNSTSTKQMAIGTQDF